MAMGISAALLWLGALHLHKSRQLPPAAAYLCVLVCSLAVLWCAAMLNLLRWAAWALFLLFLVWTALDIRREGPAAFCAGARKAVTGPVLLAWAAGALLATIYAVRQPILTYWDEFSFWGTSAKILHYDHLLYTFPGTVLTSTASDPCGAALLSYLFQFFSPDFSEAGLYLSYALFMFAVFAAAAEAVERAGTGPKAAALFFIALALSPFLQNYHIGTANFTSISYGYATSMADYLLAVGALATVVLYLAAPQARWYMAGLLYLCQIKESGVLLAVLAVCVITFWQLLRPAPGRTGLLRRAAAVACNLLAAAAGTLVWWGYVQWARTQKTALTGPLWPAAALLLAAVALWQLRGAGWARRLRADLGKHERALVPAAAVLLAGAGAVLWLKLGGILRDQIEWVFRPLLAFSTDAQQAAFYAQAWELIGDAFVHEKTLLLCTDLVLVLALMALVLLSCLFCPGRRRLALAGTQLLLAGGAAVHLFILSMVFAGTLQGQGMAEYGRLFSSYLFSWVYILFLLLLILPERPQFSQLLAAAGAVACVAGVAGLGLEHTVIAAPDNYKQESQTYIELTQQAAQILQPDDRVYLVIKSLDTDTYFRCIYYFYPAKVDKAKVDTGYNYSIIFCTEPDPDDPYRDRYHIATEEEFAEILRENFDYVFVAGDSGSYARDYGALFEGGLQPGALYRVAPDAQPLLQRVEGGRPG